MIYDRFIMGGFLLFSLSSCNAPKRNLALELERDLSRHLDTELNIPEGELPSRLSLYQARKIALRENPTLAQVRSRLMKARAVVDQQKATFSPKISAIGSYSHAYERNSASFQLPSKDLYRAGLRAEYLLFDGSLRKHSVLKAQYGSISAAALVSESQRLLLQNVTRLYYSLALLEKQSQVTLASLKLNKQLYQDAEKKLAVGVVSSIDVQNFQVRTNRDRVTLLRQEKESAVLKQSLSELMGVPLYRETKGFELIDLAVADPSKTEKRNVKELLQSALKNRSGLKALLADYAAAQEAVKEARALYKPKVAIVGESIFGRESNPRFEGGDRMSSVGLELSWDLFDGGKRSAQVKAAEAEAQAQLASLKVSWNEAIRELTSSVASLNYFAKELIILRESAALNEDIYHKSERLYEEGAISITRLNETQTNWRIAEEELASTEINFLQEEADILSFTGENILDFR